MAQPPDTINVAYVAHLARLHLTDKEIATFQPQLEHIVEYVHKLNELDLEGVEPTSHARMFENVFREDQVKPGLDHDDVIANAPLSSDGQFVVPKIVE